MNHLKSLPARGILLLLAMVAGLTAQSVSEAEVKGSKKVKFINKTNKKAIPELRNFHESIGKKLAGMLIAKPGETHFFDGVTVRRIEPSEDQLGADILYLDDSTDIGHINTIQRIISGYILTSYQYKEEDAFFLARYILYYNALNRGKIDYILSKYNKEIKNFTNQKDIGIGKSFKEWPGHTQILLPTQGNILKKYDKDLTIDELDERVNKMGDKKATEEDKRKLTEIITEKAKEEKKLIAEKKEEISKEVKKLEKDKKDIEVKLKDIGTNEGLKVETQKLEKEKGKVEEKLAKLEETKTKLDAMEGRVDKTEKVEKVEAKAEEKPAANEPAPVVAAKETAPEPPKEPSPEVVKLEKELEKVKEQLALKTEEKSQKEFSANVVDGKIPIVKIFPDGTCSNEIHLLDPNQDDFVFKGTYTQICGKTFKDFGTSLLVIGLKDSKENIRLVLLDKKELKPARFSDAGVNPKSPLEVFDNQIYAIEMDGGKYFLSRFDQDLKRITKSDTEILPDSTITVFGKKIYVAARVEAGIVEIRVFNKDDLKFIKKTQT